MTRRASEPTDEEEIAFAKGVLLGVLFGVLGVLLLIVNAHQ